MQLYLLYVSFEKWIEFYVFTVPNDECISTLSRICCMLLMIYHCCVVHTSHMRKRRKYVRRDEYSVYSYCTEHESHKQARAPGEGKREISIDRPDLDQGPGKIFRNVKILLLPHTVELNKHLATCTNPNCYNLLCIASECVFSSSLIISVPLPLDLAPPVIFKLQCVFEFKQFRPFPTRYSQSGKRDNAVSGTGAQRGMLNNTLYGSLIPPSHDCTLEKGAGQS